MTAVEVFRTRHRTRSGRRRLWRRLVRDEFVATKGFGAYG